MTAEPEDMVAAEENRRLKAAVLEQGRRRLLGEIGQQGVGVDM
jgi:hypothetical protein